jgi:hypothetical protein
LSTLGELTGLLRAYTRAFLSQGAGLVGLAWCLAENLPGASVALAVLVLIDQAVFLKGRRSALEQRGALHRLLDGWCLAVSGADVLLTLATGLRSLGVQDGLGRPVTDPLSCLAYAVASFAHVDLHLVATTGGGRLLAAATALAGDATLVAVLVLSLGRLRVRGGPDNP